MITRSWIYTFYDTNDKIHVRYKMLNRRGQRKYPLERIPICSVLLHRPDDIKSMKTLILETSYGFTDGVTPFLERFGSVGRKYTIMDIERMFKRQRSLLPHQNLILLELKRKMKRKFMELAHKDFAAVLNINYEYQQEMSVHDYKMYKRSTEADKLIHKKEIKAMYRDGYDGWKRVRQMRRRKTGMKRRRKRSPFEYDFSTPRKMRRLI